MSRECVPKRPWDQVLVSGHPSSCPVYSSQLWVTLFCPLQNKKVLLADLEKPRCCPNSLQWESGAGQEFLRAKETLLSSLRRQSHLFLPTLVARNMPGLWSQLLALWAPARLPTGLPYCLLGWMGVWPACLPVVALPILSPASSFPLSEWDA